MDNAELTQIRPGTKLCSETEERYYFSQYRLKLGPMVGIFQNIIKKFLEKRGKFLQKHKKILRKKV